MSTPEVPFAAKIVAKRPRRVNGEFACAGLFYTSVLAHLVLSFVFFGMKNTETLEFDEDAQTYSCPDGYIMCRNNNNYNYAVHLSHLCMTQSLCDEVNTCLSSRRLSDDQMRRLQSNSQVAADVWEFLEQHAYQPTVLFVSVFILASVWLLSIQRCPRGVIWGTLVADVILLIAVFLWFWIETEAINIACIIMAVGLIIFCAVCRKQIETSCVMAKVAVDGLFANRRLFAVTFGVQLVWAGFFTLWIASMITRMFVKEVRAEPDEDNIPCQVVGGWAGNEWLGLWMILHAYWVTYFAKNVNLMVITANFSGWYFKEEGFKSNWTQALKWSLFHQAGGNAMSAAFMGFLEYLANRVGSTCNLIVGFLNPFEWIFLCLGLCLKTVAQTYTKFGVIAMTFSGESFCGAAPKALRLMKNNLGEAVVVDYVGKRIMSWCTYIIAVGVGFAMWGWADAVQEATTLSALNSIVLLTVVVFTYAWLISYPFLAILLIVLLEQSLPATMDVGLRKAFNSIMASLFVGSVSFFLMSFLSGVVVNGMDVTLFCFTVEKSNGESQAERFEKLYDSVKETFVVGNVTGAGVVVGTAPANQAADTNVVTNEQPTTTVVGQSIA